MSAEDVKTQPIAFKAEIKQLLNILIHSLYKDREIFLRELISNASDAISQMEFILLTNRDVVDPDVDFEIRITADEDEKLLTIEDNGIGMTEDELVTNLGTIAQSGARAFIQAAEENQDKMIDVIGQFGVGFYSVFMVADWVRVTSRSYKPEAEAATWYATGEDSFSVEPAEKEHRGTRIEIKLKDDAGEFATEARIKDIVKKHSDYVRYPIYVGEDEEQSNRQIAIWRQSPREVEDDDYREFYQHLTLDFEPPLDHIHTVVDAPLRLYALLYIPTNPEKNVFSLRKEDGLKLYARKILIQEYTTELLPKYFRFMQGVVDAEDLPLNVSRETIQSNPLIVRIRKILTSQVLNKLNEIAKKDAEMYKKFWNVYGNFLKEGIATAEDGREDLYPLIRFKTTKVTDKLSSLNEYIGRMIPGQKKIYYILGDDETSARQSPHLDYFNKHGYEVITFTDTMDSFMLINLREYEGFDFTNVADPNLKLGDEDAETEDEDAEATKKEEIQPLIERFKAHLGEKVTDVRPTNRLTNSIARLVDPEDAMGQEMQRVYRIMDRDYQVPKKVLEINPNHPVIEKLSHMEDQDRQTLIMDQIYESALLIEGLHPDPAAMLPRIQKLMELALES